MTDRMLTHMCTYTHVVQVCTWCAYTHKQATHTHISKYIALEKKHRRIPHTTENSHIHGDTWSQIK